MWRHGLSPCDGGALSPVVVGQAVLWVSPAGLQVPPVKPALLYLHLIKIPWTTEQPHAFGSPPLLIV